MKDLNHRTARDQHGSRHDESLELCTVAACVGLESLSVSKMGARR